MWVGWSALSLRSRWKRRLGGTFDALVRIDSAVVRRDMHLVIASWFCVCRSMMQARVHAPASQVASSSPHCSSPQLPPSPPSPIGGPISSKTKQYIECAQTNA